jgi:hypothetical protein
MKARLLRAALRIAVVAALAFPAPQTWAAPRTAASPVVPLLNIFAGLAARNRVYRTAEEFIADRNAYYDRLRDTAGQQLVRRDISTLRTSQTAAYVKLVAAIEQERSAMHSLAESLKQGARNEFQQRLQNALTSALLGSGPAQRLVRVVQQGIRSAQDGIDVALEQLGGGGGGVLAEVARVRGIADRINQLSGLVGGPAGANLRRISSRVIRTIDGVTQPIEADLNKVSQDLDGLSGVMDQLEEVGRTVNGSVTGRDVLVRVVTGESDNPTLEAVIAILGRQSVDAGNLQQQGRDLLQAGFVARCAARASAILQALAELEGGAPVDSGQVTTACQQLPEAGADATQTAEAGAGSTLEAQATLDASATQAAQQTQAAVGTATETARQTEEAQPPPLTDFSGSWQSGGTCDNPAAPFRWTVNLQQDDEGKVTGRITFHNCPGGGRSEYSVSGQATLEDTLTLQGTKDLSLGGLGGSTPGSTTFTITKGGPPEPNYAP